jgi:hypothetical protein
VNEVPAYRDYLITLNVSFTHVSVLSGAATNYPSKFVRRLGVGASGTFDEKPSNFFLPSDDNPAADEYHVEIEFKRGVERQHPSIGNCWSATHLGIPVIKHWDLRLPVRPALARWNKGETMIPKIDALVSRGETNAAVVASRPCTAPRKSFQ